MGIRKLSEEVVTAISPNSLLLGRTYNQADCNYNYEDGPSKHTRQLKAIDDLEKEWWQKWSSQCWDSIFSYYKKSDVERNTSLKVGDICLLSYKHRLSKDLFRICCVTKIVTGDIDAPGTVEI